MSYETIRQKLDARFSEPGFLVHILDRITTDALRQRVKIVMWGDEEFDRRYRMYVQHKIASKRAFKRADYWGDISGAMYHRYLCQAQDHKFIADRIRAETRATQTEIDYA